MHSYPSASPSLSKAQRVKVLVVGSLTPPDVSEYLLGILQQYARNVITAIQAIGADVRTIEASAPECEIGEALQNINAVLILGGADADPACYGQRSTVDTMYGINRDADQFELDLIRRAIAQNLPVLGICRGVQLINIAYGGDLIQEIGPDTIHNSSADNSIMTSHPVTPISGSRLGTIYKGRTISVRSGHHQAVDRVGKGLLVTARAEDGIVEALEAEGPQWIVGVQWHPEDQEAPPEDLAILISSFVEVARGCQLK